MLKPAVNRIFGACGSIGMAQDLASSVSGCVYGYEEWEISYLTQASPLQMAEMGRKIASDAHPASGVQASAEALAAAAADKAKLEHRLAQLSAEVSPSVILHLTSSQNQ